MKILITGANGYIGSYLSEYLKKIGQTIPHTDNLNKISSLPKCDVIVHCAGRTPRLDSRVVEMLENHTLATNNLLNLAGNIPVVYLSTKAIENDYVALLLNSYCVSKLLAELLIKDKNPKSIILRIPKIVDKVSSENEISLENLGGMVEKAISDLSVKN